MSEVIFEQRAVAFIDVLGFSSLVDKSVASAEGKTQLQLLVDLLETAIPLLDNGVSSTVPTHLFPKHIYISDCIILSAPLTDSEARNYSGLEIVVMRCIQLTHRFLEAGYLLRGGITIGDVWHSNANIVGPAYQEAYCIETKNRNPSIVLSDTAKKHWGKGFGAGSRMCVLDKDGNLMVNGLHDYYMADKSCRGVERTFETYTEIVDAQIEAGLKPDAEKKWKWFKSYFESENSEDNKWPGLASNAA